MLLRVACIVEGHGDVEAVPILVRRIATLLDPVLALDLPPPLRVPRTKLLKPDECERAVEFAARKAGRLGGLFCSGAILVFRGSL